MTDKKQSNLQAHGALWKRTSKNGRIYYSGQLEGDDSVKLLAFANENADEANGQPHVRLFTAPKDDDTRNKPKTVSQDDPIPF